MDPPTDFRSDSKEKLLPPEGMLAESVVEISPGKTRGAFGQSASTRLVPVEKPQVHYHYQDAEHTVKSGGPLRTLGFILFALALCGAFGLLYSRMLDLEGQVQALRELTAAAEKQELLYGWNQELQDEPGYFDDEQLFDLDDEPTVGMEDDGGPEDAAANERRKRSAAASTNHRLAKRTVSSGRRVAAGSSGHNDHSTRHVFAHLVPLLNNAGVDHRNYHASEFLEWTDDHQYAFSQFELEHNKFLVVPYTGYYYVYSQATVSDATNGRAKGHGLWVRSRCGQAEWQELSYTLTTQSNGTYSSPARDSSFLGGVFFLRQHDHVGVKPRPLLTSSTYVRFMRTETTDYFGAIMLSRLPTATPGCSHFNNWHN